ncbi:MAG: hypothetical protein V4555_17820 [Acidobacteriota bacterium]
MTEQQRLPFKREKPPLPAQRKAQDEANLITARIILEKPQFYAGLQVEWANRIIAKANRLEC